MKSFVIIICATLLFTSCKTETSKPKVEKKIKLDTIVPVNSVEDALDRSEVGVNVSQANEEKKNALLIEKKYGEQWDFCTCVLANDSITDAFEKKMTPPEEAKLMARWDYVDIKCKELTTFDQTIPDQRLAHDKKVLKCLKAAKRKK